MKWIWFLVACLIVCFCLYGPVGPVMGFDKADASAASDGGGVYVSGDTLPLKQRREMGLTIGNIVRASKELKKSGQIDKGMSRSEVAASILDKLSGENPKAFSNPQANWDAILAFIEKLVPLILMLIGGV